MAIGQRTRSAPIRAFLKQFGINRSAHLLEKSSDLCYNDFLEALDSNTAPFKKVPLHGYSKKSLTSGVAADLMSFTLPSGSYVGFLVRATIVATNGTDYQAFTELLEITTVNKAGTATNTVTNLSTVGSKTVSGGTTLTTSWAVTTVGTGTEKLQLTATTNLSSPTVLDVHFTVENFFPPPAITTPPTFL